MWAKLSACVSRLKTVRVARRFVRQQSGVAAVEFGMIAAPFLALIFAILETSVIFFAGQALETAVLIDEAVEAAIPVRIRKPAVRIAAAS